MITFNEETKQFHLSNCRVSYILRILEDGSLGQVYFGKAVRDGAFLDKIPFGGFSNNSGAYTRFEYPVYGNGDFRSPAFSVYFPEGLSGGQGAGSIVVSPQYARHTISAGKPEIPNPLGKGFIPATYAEVDNEASTLEIELLDEASGLKVILYWTIFKDYNCIARHARFVNGGKKRVILKSATSLSLDLPDDKWNLITLTGAWGREFEIGDAPLRVGFQGVSSRRGVSSPQANPALVLRRPHTTEQLGEAAGFVLVYSGSYEAAVEVDQLGIARVQLGIQNETFSWDLESGASFDTPEALAFWSDGGLGGLSQELHGLLRKRLARGTWRDKERPVLLNNWEGTYFNFTAEKIVGMAKSAQELGAELFVLDDGWFGKRDDDTTSLGDWFPHKQKLPGGIKELADKVIAQGIKFGLWIEPEMVNPDSELFRTHPDWAVQTPGRPLTLARTQLVLDLGRQDVRDYLFDIFDGILKSAPISYIKWDMNRYITEPWSAALPPERQGEFFHRYCLGVYDLYYRLTSTHPEVLFESCSSGGARFDAGILAFAPQGWLSDDTDALERLLIQEGASLVYPQSSFGAHVSAVPNHQTGRTTPLSFRAPVSFFGCLGYELDPEKLTGEEREAVKKQIAFYKAHRATFQQGRFLRLLSAAPGRAHLGGPYPENGRYATWLCVGKDEAVLAVWKILANPNRRPFRLKLAGLDASARYKVSVWEEGGFSETDRDLNCGKTNDAVRGGDDLMNAGLLLEAIPPNKLSGDFFAEVFVLKMVG